MDDLTYELRQMCHRNRDGGRKTQAQRMQSLTLIARQLKEGGFRNMRATSLKEKHVDALVDRWKAENLSAGTVKNRMSHLRFWAQKVGKAGAIPAGNAALGIPQRQSSGVNKAKSLDSEQLDRVNDAHVRMSLRLQQAFGLRREESIKFQPAYADRGDRIALKGSWCKGGRPRSIPITTAEQRAALNDAHALAGSGALIPAREKYIQQQNRYDDRCQSAELCNMHGLRHAYAQARYEILTGWKSPFAGGPAKHELTPEQRAIDTAARQPRTGP
ncbi:phage integrase N-terminal domain-containing protein [Devosia sp.]|uniref:phage integrase N-terminal domain-containing protein n=1 Tax=Devosia sp. TaxID=1871048 RepID=UPI0025BA4D46|nr:phage integrase N-terminal domain-containing protein [Devosia sp.]